MNAPLIQPPDPRRKSGMMPKKRQQPKTNTDKLMAIEITTKLAVNIFLSAVALGTIIQLWAYYNSQQSKLGELQTEVKQTEKRVNRLRSDFNRNFDPQQSQSIMQEQSPLIDPTQRQILWLEKNHPEEDQGENP